MGCAASSKRKNSGKIKKNINEISIIPGTFVKINPTEFTKVYSVGRSLGSGAFGEVKFCTHLKTNSRRAVKVFKKDTMLTEISKKKFKKEIEILKVLDHPNIVKIFEFFEDSLMFYIVMEHCRGGELFDDIMKLKKYSEHECAQIMRQLLSCISYLHSINVVHRDLKPENILFDEKSDFMNIKLIDFGSAEFFSKKPLSESIGTPYYVPPEVLQGNYTEKCDLWSTGVILYILIVGVPPFDGPSSKEIFKKISAGSYDKTSAAWKNASPEVKDLIENLLVSEAYRSTASEALDHLWIKKHTSSALSQVMLSTSLANLSIFDSQNKIKDAVRTFIASQLISSEETKQAKEIFRALDENGDGKLSKQELIVGYSAIIGEVEAVNTVEKIMSHVDTDNNGFLEYSEFIKAVVDEKSIMTRKNIKLAFEMFDRENRGKISAEGFKQALQGDENVDEEVWENIVKLFAVENGEIDLHMFEDFLLN